MLGKTHFVFGLVLSTFFTQPFYWVVILISSLLPDIDQKNSVLGRKVKFVSYLFEHRGFFHSLLFFIPLTIVIYSFSPEISLAFTLGYGGHLFLDSMTKQGLRLFPFKKRIKGFIKVGGKLESFFFILLLSIFIFRLWL